MNNEHTSYPAAIHAATHAAIEKVGLKHDVPVTVTPSAPPLTLPAVKVEDILSRVQNWWLTAVNIGKNCVSNQLLSCIILFIVTIIIIVWFQAPFAQYPHSETQNSIEDAPLNPKTVIGWALLSVLVYLTLPIAIRYAPMGVEFVQVCLQGKLPAVAS